MQHADGHIHRVREVERGDGVEIVGNSADHERQDKYPEGTFDHPCMMMVRHEREIGVAYLWLGSSVEFRAKKSFL